VLRDGVKPHGAALHEHFKGGLGQLAPAPALARTTASRRAAAAALREGRLELARPRVLDHAGRVEAPDLQAAHGPRPAQGHVHLEEQTHTMLLLTAPGGGDSGELVPLVGARVQRERALNP
jgi:hypothetical protein